MIGFIGASITISYNSSQSVTVFMTRSIHYWVTSVFFSTVTDLFLIHESLTSGLRTTNVEWRRTYEWIRSESESYVTTDGQSASLSWIKEPIWGLRSDFYYCQRVAGLLIWGALSDERTGLSFAIDAGSLQSSHSRIRVARDTRQYFIVSDSRLPFSSPPTARRATVEVFETASTWDSCLYGCLYSLRSPWKNVGCLFVSVETFVDIVDTDNAIFRNSVSTNPLLHSHVCQLRSNVVAANTYFLFGKTGGQLIFWLTRQFMSNYKSYPWKFSKFQRKSIISLLSTLLVIKFTLFKLPKRSTNSTIGSMRRDGEGWCYISPINCSTKSDRDAFDWGRPWKHSKVRNTAVWSCAWSLWVQRRAKQGSNLLLAFANTVILGFRFRQDIWPYEYLCSLSVCYIPHVIFMSSDGQQRERSCGLGFSSVVTFFSRCNQGLNF
jgi:hypothetical protein